MTKLLYLEKFDVLSCTTRVVKVATTDDGRTDVELEATCFYPRGGGQDWDTGAIKSAASVFNVEEVRTDDGGVVHHIGAGTVPSPGVEVKCEVDDERRSLNTRLHSAGHLIDVAVDRMKLPWIPGKGAHYPHMSFVEYEGPWDADQAVAIREKLEVTVNELVAEGGENEIRYLPYEDMQSICRHVPDNLPHDKPGRVVIYCGDFGIPCGGTHVSNLSKIGTIDITKIKKKDKNIRVSYTVSGATAM